MAFSGLHVSCARTGGDIDRDRISLLGPVTWSEAPADGVTSTNAAPGVKNGKGYPVFEIYSSTDAYFAYGVNPNADTGPRLFVPAATLIDVLVEPGDRFAWTAA